MLFRSVLLYIINKSFIKENFTILCDDNSYFDTQKNNCITCPLNSYVNNNKNGCITCPDNSYLNNNKNGCITCPDNYILNNDKTGCITPLDNIINNNNKNPPDQINYTKIDNILNSTNISDDEKFKLVCTACNTLGPFYDFSSNTYYFNKTTKASVNWSLDNTKKKDVEI